MLKGELTLEEARKLVKAGRIVYIVANQDEIVKIFDYHREAGEYASQNGMISHNVTHPRCPRAIKFELGKLEQLDLFLDYAK